MRSSDQEMVSYTTMGGQKIVIWAVIKRKSWRSDLVAKVRRELNPTRKDLCGKHYIPYTQIF